MWKRKLKEIKSKNEEFSLKHFFCGLWNFLKRDGSDETEKWLKRLNDPTTTGFGSNLYFPWCSALRKRRQTRVGLSLFLSRSSSEKKIRFSKMWLSLENFCVRDQSQNFFISRKFRSHSFNCFTKSLIFTSVELLWNSDEIIAMLPSITAIDLIEIQLGAFSHAQVHHVVFLLLFSGKYWEKEKTFVFTSFLRPSTKRHACFHGLQQKHTHSTSDMYKTLFMMENMKVSIFCLRFLKVATMNKKWKAFFLLKALRRSKMTRIKGKEATSVADLQ